MQRIYSLFVLFYFLLGHNLLAQETNYIQESVYIKKISAKLNDTAASRIKFIVQDGIPEPATDSKRAFNNLVEKLVAVSKMGTSDVRHTSGQSSAGGAPTPGEGGQPQESPREQPQSADVQQDQLKEEIANELLYILFISSTDDPQLLQQIIGTVPRKFNYLETIAENLALFNSSEGKTNFAFSESEIIYGIVDFTISRAKEQVVETYLSNWLDNLSDNEFTRQMLPNTLSTLKAFNADESLNVAQYGDKWKAAFQEDFRNFPLLLQKDSFVCELLNKTQLSNNEKGEIRAIITGGSQLAYDLYQKKHLVTAVNDMSSNYLIDIDRDYPAFKRLIVLSDVLLKAGGTLEENGSYNSVSVDDISRLEYAAWKIFIKLLYIRNKNALDYVSRGKIDVLLSQLLQNEKIDRFAKLYRQTINLIATYQKSINAVNLTTSQLSFEDTRKIFELGFDLTEQVTAYLPYVTQEEAYNNIKQGVAFINKAKPYYTAMSQIGEGIANRRYGSVLDGTVTIVRLIDTGQQGNLIYYLQRYGSFMVNIINAKDAEHVKSALDELIPKNLYKLKNTREFTVSLSSYPGIFAGPERVSKFPSAQDGTTQTAASKENSWAFAPAVYLPIGFDLNWGIKRKASPAKLERHSSFNLFFQAIDLGAVLNYRVSGSNSGEESDPNITFKQVLSPGLAVMKHFNNSPFVIGAQMSYTPALRTINQGENEYKSNALRFGVFLAVDVTYFNLYTSKNKVK